MSVNSGTGGFDPERYGQELRAYQHMLETVPVAGEPRREAELADLARLVDKYLDEARALVEQRDASRGKQQ